ncbi:hypothetical protein Sango_2958100 [Sesamum angolense]|uniref:DUF4283 domain-containing protein n=1 Tax=Sesamum angolense TaxID=2727404 RepID=A0AAE1T3B9_9LAMI|nr:hypothetical protein Sango_2958100 [Sesamum angolense]
MAALTSLREKWEGKFGKLHAQPLKPVADRTATPFRVEQRPIRFPRQVHLGSNSESQSVKIFNSDSGGRSFDTSRFSIHNLLNSKKLDAVCDRVDDDPLSKDNSVILDEETGEEEVPVDVNSNFFVELHYIPPTVQKGEIVVRPTTKVIEHGSQRWNTTAVGYFLGSKPYFHHLESFAKKNWPSLLRVNATVNGFFFFQFNSIAAMEEVIEGGPWLYQGQPIVLQRWEPGMSLRKQKHTQIPVWIRLKHLPMEYWTTEGLSVIASGVGKPLYSDAVTKQCSRLDYARVCVMLDYNSTLPKHLVIISPILRDGREVPVRVDIEYEWLPQRCKECQSLGHTATSCPGKKKLTLTKPVEVYVQKARSTAEVVLENEVEHVQQLEVGQSITVATREQGISVELNKQELRPKGNLLKQPAEHAYMICAAAWNVRGLNGVAHQSSVGQLVVLYGENELVKRRGLWQGLIQLSSGITDEPWLVMGDFNAVLDDSEVNGDGERSLWKRLDRMLVNEAWLAKWPQSKYISTFENYMTKMPGFQRLVEEHWGQQINGTDMYILTRKLKAMKPILRKFRKTHGDLSHNVQQAALFLQKAQQLLQEFKHESILLQLEKCCRMIYCKATKMELNMLKQRAKLAWLKGGDNCSKIFFRKITARRASQRVYQIQNEDGHLLTDYTAVTGEFVNYFKKLFGGSQRQTQNLEHLQPFARYLISEDEATQIISPVQRHEIREALADINEDSAPGPDGFSSGFFKASWDVIGEDVCRAVMEFFNHDRLLKQLNATLITLIPKVQLPTKVGDFRPIACCNVIYKIITKIMVKRMQLVLEKLVDNCQNAFVQKHIG